MIRWAAEIVMAFVGTNIDNLIMTSLLLALARTGTDRRNVCAAQFVGMGILFVISMAGAKIAVLFPMAIMQLLGVVPITIGIREWIKNKRTETAEENHDILPGLTEQIAMTLSGGMDNISVYIPMLGGFEGIGQIVFAFIGFMGMMGILCFAAAGISGLAALKKQMQIHAARLIPTVYILLGVYILVRNYW